MSKRAPKFEELESHHGGRYYIVLILYPKYCGFILQAAPIHLDYIYLNLICSTNSLSESEQILHSTEQSTHLQYYPVLTFWNTYNGSSDIQKIVI